MSQKKRILTIVWTLLALLLLLPIWIEYREFRQERLDHALIEAIKAENDRVTLEALAEGASGEARDTGEVPTFRRTLQHLLDHFRHPGASAPDPEDSSDHLHALLLYFQIALENRGNGDRRNPDSAVVRALLDHGAHVNDRGSVGMTPLWCAANFSDGDTVSLLLARGADTEAKITGSGMTPLIVADAGVAKILLEHGANIEAVDENRQTALIDAAYHCELNKARILLEHGSKVGIEDIDGMTALGYAKCAPFDSPNNDGYADRRREALKIVILLHQHGAK